MYRNITHKENTGYVHVMYRMAQEMFNVGRLLYESKIWRY